MQLETMFSLDREHTYWLFSEPTDMRKSFYTLGGLVTNRMGADPRNGDVYIFVNRRHNRIKLLHYEKGGMVIYSKMLDRGTFGMPVPASKDTVSSLIRWDSLLRIVEGTMSDPDNRQARLESLKGMWEK